MPDVLGTKVGRLVAAEFADPARLAALGVTRFIRFAAHRELRVSRPVAERLVSAARDALPTRDAVVARRVLAADLVLLGDLDQQISQAEQELAELVPISPFRTLTSVPGGGVVRAASYGAAGGDPTRWPGPSQLYRAAGLSPMQYESGAALLEGRQAAETAWCSAGWFRPGARRWVLSLRYCASCVFSRPVRRRALMRSPVWRRGL